MKNNSIFDPNDKLNDPTPLFNFSSNEQVQEEKYYIYQPFELNNEVKLSGAKFDVEQKLWYFTNIDNNPTYELYKKQYLINAYKNKDTYAKFKAKYDYDMKLWYTYKSNENLKDYFV